MLAGRVIDRKFFPLTRAELKQEFNLQKALQLGTLPAVCQKPEFAVDILEPMFEHICKKRFSKKRLLRT